MDSDSEIGEGVDADEHDFRLTLDSLPGFVCTNTAEGAVERVNETLLAYTGRTLEQLGSLRRDRRSLRHGGPVLHADGVCRWFHCRGVALRDGGGRICS